MMTDVNKPANADDGTRETPPAKKQAAAAQEPPPEPELVERLLDWAVKIPPPKRSRRRLLPISLKGLRPRKDPDSSSKRTQLSFVRSKWLSRTDPWTSPNPLAT